MNIFKGLLFAAVILVVLAYLFLIDNGTTVKQPLSPTQPKPQTQAPAAAPPAPSVKNVTDHDGMTPPWPPTGSVNDNFQLDDLLTRNNYILILDGSGSMNRQECSGSVTKIEVAKQAVTEWSASIPDDANLGLLVFDKNGFSIRLPLGRNNREQFRSEVSKVVADYKTPLTKSLNAAYFMLTEQGRKQLGYGEYTVVIVTDGVADDVNSLELSVDSVLGSSPVMIHTIGFCIANDHSLNRQGRTTYRSANNPAELRQGLRDVLAESETFDITGF